MATSRSGQPSSSQESQEDFKELRRRVTLLKRRLKAALHLSSMRLPHFCYTAEHGFEEAKQMAFLAEQRNCAVHSERNGRVEEALTARLEKKAAKQIAKSRLKRGWETGRKVNRPAAQGSSATLSDSIVATISQTGHWRTLAVAEEVNKIRHFGKDLGCVEVPLPEYKIWNTTLVYSNTTARMDTTSTPSDEGRQSMCPNACAGGHTRREGRKLTAEHAIRQMQVGKLVLSSFLVCRGEEE